MRLRTIGLRPLIPEMVSAVEDPDRGLFTSPLVQLLSRTTCRPYPLSPLHSSLSIVFCFQKADTYVDGWSGARACGEVAFLLECIVFFAVYFRR